MTEAEWLVCADPAEMVDSLRGKVSGRKLRLFAAACVRRTWHLYKADVPYEVVVSERFADGDISIGQLRAVRSRLGARGGYSTAWAANNALHAVLETDPAIAAKSAIVHAGYIVYFAVLEKDVDWDRFQAEATAARQAESWGQTEVLRDVMGNPFRPVGIEPPWRTPGVMSIAQAIYDGRASDRMPALGDALEAAGCDNSDILSHCRSPDKHERGCWAVDAILRRS